MGDVGSTQPGLDGRDVGKNVQGVAAGAVRLADVHLVGGEAVVGWVGATCNYR